MSADESTDAHSGTYAARLLREAADIVGGARNKTHGDKERSFQGIADLWNAYRANRSRLPITAGDVAVMMVLMKAARTAHGVPLRDHFVDMAGYAAIAGELTQMVEAEPDAVLRQTDIVTRQADIGTAAGFAITVTDTGPARTYPSDDDVDGDTPAWQRPPK